MNRVANRMTALAAAIGLGSGMTLPTGCRFQVNLPTEDTYRIRLDPVPIKPRIPQPILSAEALSPEEVAEDAERARYKAVVQNRRNRNAEIRQLKADRVIGENHRALLEVQENLEGTGWENELEYVRETVEAENRDRNYLIEREADFRGKPEDDVRRNMWRQWQRRSFEGEWIEVRGRNAGTYRWIQKPAASD